MSGEYVVNPILVQGYHPDIPHVQDNIRLLKDSDDEAINQAFIQRVENQRQLGPDPQRYFDLSHPEDLTLLSPHRLAELKIAHSVSTNIDAMPYFLAETALTDLRMYEDLRCKLWGKMALLRVEEGLTWRAAEVMHVIKQSLKDVTYPKDGKTYVVLPGIKSPVPIAGWWLDAQEPGEDGASEKQSIPDIPSCETYMSATIYDQSYYGDSLVRIVPWSMEDREVAAMRMLQFSNMLPTFRNASSVIVAQNGDIKKIRTWINSGNNTELADILHSHKVDGKVSKLTERYSKDKRQYYAERYRQLPQVIRNVYTSPNQPGGSTQERFTRFLTDPYTAFPINEHHKPQDGTSVTILRETFENIREIKDVRGGMMMGTFKDASGNIFGIIDNPIA